MYRTVHSYMYCNVFVYMYTCTKDWEILKSVIFRTIKDLIFSSISSYEITEKKQKKIKIF